MNNFPDFELPQMKQVEFSTEQIRAMSDSELAKALNGEYGDGDIVSSVTINALLAEKISRTIKASSKPHWTVLPTFGLVFISVLLSGHAVYKQYFPDNLTALQASINLSQSQNKTQPQETNEQPTEHKSELAIEPESPHDISSPLPQKSFNKQLHRTIAGEQKVSCL